MGMPHTDIRCTLTTRQGRDGFQRSAVVVDRSSPSCSLDLVDKAGAFDLPPPRQPCSSRAASRWR